MKVYNVGRRVGEHFRKVFDDSMSRSFYRSFVSGLVQGIYSGKPLAKDKLSDYSDVCQELRRLRTEQVGWEEKNKRYQEKMISAQKELTRLKRQQ